MSKKLETKFDEKLDEQLADVGAKVLNIHGHMYQKSGWPDRYISHWKWDGWLELKTMNYKLDPLQARIMEALNDRGTNAFTLRHYGKVYLERYDGMKLWECEFGNGMIVEILAYLEGV